MAMWYVMYVLVSILANEAQIIHNGTLSAQFDNLGKIDILEMHPQEHQELVPRAQLLQSAQSSPDVKNSPNASKSANKKGAQQRQKQLQVRDQLPHAPVPDSMVNTDVGTTKGVQQFLEVR